MYRNIYPSDYSVANRSLLFVGFDHDFDANIRRFPYESPSYHYTIENNAFLAYRWLEERVEQLETFHLPYAIFCRLDWLVDNQFLFVRQIAAHPDLCFVPIIALSEQGSLEQHQAILAKENVDDCYSVPVDWDKLEERLEFLNQYKPTVLEQTQRLKKESFQLKIPLEKRIFDVFGASLAILLTAWIWLPVMVAIWLESGGPVIYKSKRVGFGYRVINFLKFRSMFADSDQQLHEVQHLNRYHAVDGQENVFVKIPQDPRITRVGRFIRKYSIDELPQLLNVLRGEMSIIGPRPERPEFVAELSRQIPLYAHRDCVKPGLTGWAQVSYPYGASVDDAWHKLSYDLYYIKHRSALLDLLILLATVRVILFREGAR